MAAEYPVDFKDLPEGEHTSRLGYAEVVYWSTKRGGSVAACKEDADECSVTLGPPSRYPEYRFALPRQRQDLEQLLRILLAAFKTGIRHELARVQDALGIAKDARARDRGR